MIVCRWIKYEEDLEETGQWGKPHVAALDCHSVIELIRVLNSGICMLDFAAKDMPDMLHRVVETLSESSIISADQKVEVGSIDCTAIITTMFTVPY
jgi:hypothetical protein